MGVAFSGGGDSTFLLHAAAAWGRAHGRAVLAATVDHGLRDGSTAEANGAAAHASALGVSHRILRWTGVKPTSGVQAAARRARYRLLCRWAEAEGLSAVLLGHTRDDVAETHVMRAARAGPEFGLAAMSEDFRAAAGAGPAQRFLRPLLTFGRADLRDALVRLGADWIEDPSNADERFERVRLRRALEPADRERAADRAFALRAERSEMERRVLVAAERTVDRSPYGFAVIRPAEFAATPPPLRPRLLSWTLCAISGAWTPPSRDALAARTAALCERRERPGSLHGCIFIPWRDGWAVMREVRAMERRLKAAPGDPFWDRRFIVDDGGAVQTLGETSARRLARDHDAPWRAFVALPARAERAYFESDPPWARFVGAYPTTSAVRRF